MLNVNFNGYGKYVTDHLYQWDKNRVLSITGLDLDVVPEIHFTNVTMDKAIVRQSTVTDGVIKVDIPNSLLQAPFAIIAYVGVYEGTLFKTIETIKIPVITRARPADYTIENTDGEIYSFKALENEIANAKKDIADQCDDNLVEMQASIEKNNKMLNSRIDNIITHNNDIEGNTELIDMRVDYEGNTHASAGEAVRYHTGKLSNEIGSIFRYPDVINYYDKKNSVLGKWINNVTQSGSIEDLFYLFYNMVHLPLPGEYYLKYPVGSVGQNNYKLTFFDKNQKVVKNEYGTLQRNATYVSGEGNDTIVKFTLTKDMIDAGVYYLGYTQSTNKVDSLMVCRGLYPDEYIQYNYYAYKDNLRINPGQIEITNPFDYPGEEVRVFTKGFFAGDSLTKGTFDHKETGSLEWEIIQKYSYPSYFSKLYGMTCSNWGIGGENTKSWYEKVSIDGRSTDYDFAVIALGANDLNLTNEVSKEYYQKIIDMLKNDNKGIKIFCCTVTPAYYEADQDFYETYNENVVKPIVNENSNCYLVDLTKYSKCHKNSVYAQGHLTALGYLQQAREIGSMISYIIAENPSEFKNVQFIGTDFSYS